MEQGNERKRTRIVRPYPTDELEEALTIARAIKLENAGQPMTILDLAQAISRKPNSSAFRSLITSSNKYGLTTGGYKGADVTLSAKGASVVAPLDESESFRALIDAALEPTPFRGFYSKYDQNKFPQDQIAINVLEREFDIPASVSKECLELLRRNAGFVGILRDIGGSIYVDISSGNVAKGEPNSVPSITENTEELPHEEANGNNGLSDNTIPVLPHVSEKSIVEENKRIFIGHGKNHKPVDQLEKVLLRFKIPFARAEYEPNGARPISQKVDEIMRACNASILVFTADEELRDTEGNPVWKPSENVVHELGAASVLHGNRIVIFKEDVIEFPSNFRDIGYISFEKDRLDSKGVELVSELISFGLLSVSVG